MMRVTKNATFAVVMITSGRRPAVCFRNGVHEVFRVVQMLDQIHEEDLIVGRKVRRQARARRGTNCIRVLRQFVGGKIDCGHAAVTPS